MKPFLVLLFSLILICSCDILKLTPEQINIEKSAIEERIAELNKGYESEDADSLIKILSKSDELIGFGTDSAEVNTSLDHWRKQFEYDFQLFDSLKFGDLRNLSIQIANRGYLASAVYEVPIDFVSANRSGHILLRFANTWIKEDGEWRIIQFVAASATKGRSSAELVEQMKESTE